MKKLSILSLTLMFIAMTSDNVHGHYLKKKTNLPTISTYNSETRTLEQEDTAVSHAKSTPTNSDLYKMMAQFEKLTAKVEEQERDQSNLEKSVNSLKNQIGENKELVDNSILSHQNEIRGLGSVLKMNIDTLKVGLASTKNLIKTSKEQEVFYDIKLTQASADIEGLKNSTKIQEWIIWAIWTFLIGLTIFILYQWRQKVKMRRTLDQIMYKKYPEYMNLLNTPSDGYGFPVGSTGPESLHLDLKPYNSN